MSSLDADTVLLSILFLVVIENALEIYISLRQVSFSVVPACSSQATFGEEFYQCE